MQCEAVRAHRWRRTHWGPLVAKSVSRSLCEETTRDVPLVFHGIAVAPTGDISTGQVLPLARLFGALCVGCALYCDGAALVDGGVAVAMRSSMASECCVSARGGMPSCLSFPRHPPLCSWAWLYSLVLSGPSPPKATRGLSSS